jgi:hypothetical protein
LLGLELRTAVGTAFWELFQMAAHRGNFFLVKYSLLLTVFAPLLAGPAMAVCNVPQPRLVCAEYFASRVVVEATLLRTRAVHDKDDPEGVAAYVYTLRTDLVLRGDIAAQFQIYEENSSGRAAFVWKAGQQYLLFLFNSAQANLWELDGCGNSGPLGDAKAVLAQINAIQGHHDKGVIHGLVSEGPASPIPGVRVEARGTGRRYTATTNARGEFQMEVPGGRYMLHAIRTGLSFHTADLSYEDPRNVRIEPGGCAQVQFTGEPTTSVPSQEHKQ